MTDKYFNLADEKWIKVLNDDMSAGEVSLREALINAHLYKGLAGEMETQNITILRVLIALVHTVLTRDNPERYEDVSAALKSWKELMDAGCFPDELIKDYLEKWHDHFWLFHPTHPFFQVPSAANGTKSSVAKLNGEVSRGEHKERLFSSISGTDKRMMSFAEGARWLLYLNGFDDCAAKQKDKSDGSRSTTVAWLGKLGLVSVVGSNLFESIMLNMPMLKNGIEMWENEDMPAWELDVPRAKERQEIPVPDDLAGMLTVQSRRIFLEHDENGITGFALLGGDSFPDKDALNEQMTLWRLTVDDKTKQSMFIPKRHERSRQIWRDFEALADVNGDNQKRAGVIAWCDTLRRKKLIPKSKLITIRIACTRYDSSQSSSITDSFSDALTFHTDLLTELGRAWRDEINEQVAKADRAAACVGNLAVNLAKAVGQTDKDTLADANKAAKQSFYNLIDIPFRDWLIKLDPSYDSDERLLMAIEWQNSARMIALTLGRNMVDEKGDVAFVGRSLTENKKDRHYSSPEAYKWFKRELMGESLYPYLKEGDENNG